MQELLALVEKHLGARWIDLVEWLREQNALDEVDARLRALDYEGAIREVEKAAQAFAADIHAGYTEAGQQVAGWLDGQVENVVHFDVANDRAVAWAKQNAAELVQGLTDEQREMAKTVIADGIARGENPWVIAKDLRASIGLTPDQAQAVVSYRRALESQDYGNALDRALSDGRSDRTIAAAQRRGDALTQEQVDTAVERYRHNFITYRAETVARTEALASVHAGADEGFRQAIDRGDVEADDLVGQWMPGPATKDARPLHRTSDLLDQRPKVGQPFILGDGTRMQYPGDPAGGAEHNANCRCTKVVQFAATAKRLRLPAVTLPRAWISTP